MDLSDEIKSKLDIVDVIRDYIQLKPAGVNFRAVCPFHNEKTPSFVVSPEKQIWHCFGCGKGGDMYSFVMEIENINFVETLRLLAPKAGVQFKLGDPAMSSQRNRLLDIMELSVRYYNKVLTDSRQAESTRNYLEKRGLTSDTISEWRIGYSPDSWDDLINFLKGRGFKDNEIYLSGMSIKKEGTNRYYNRFRDRIMFPIADASGNVVAFTARVSPEKEATETMGKYVNSPQTTIFDKSKVLFGLDKAKGTIKRTDRAIIVEGQMDVITAHQHGYSNVVAASGTALTTEQVTLIKRFTNNIDLAFDMDKAGEAALERGMQEAMAAEMNIKVIRLPQGKDPDECIKNNSIEWEEAVQNSRPMMQYLFDKAIIDLNLKDVNDKQKAAKKLLPIIYKLGNKIEQDHWLKNLSQLLDAKEDILREALQKITGKADNQTSSKKPMSKPASQPKQARTETLSENLLSLLLKFPELIEFANNKIQAEYLIGQENQSLYKNLAFYYNKNTEKNHIQLENTKEFFLGFVDWLRNEQEFNAKRHNITNQQELIGRLAILADKDYLEYDLEQAKLEIINILNILRKNYNSERMKEIQKALAEAEQRKDEGEIEGLMEELRILIDEQRQLDNVS